MSISSWFAGNSENVVPEVLWEDGERVCRRMRSAGPDGARREFVAVFPALEVPSPESINRLTHEYELKDYLDSAWAVRPIDLVRGRGRTLLVIEHPAGEPLSRLIGQPMEIGQFLRIAIALSATVCQLHGRRLIHKDIKPSNILANSATGEVWLTGFGIASRLPRERQTPVPPGSIAGTLAYMSPEQTGRMNRSIDTRSDLYSVGVTFYQMLTGVVPFTAADPLEWVHCHIARQPVPPADRRRIPETLSAIIMRLLAKNAEERYQTATGLESDLHRCLSQWQSQGRIDPFPLGKEDSSVRLLIPEKLYGREREVDTLLAAFDRVIGGGRPELVLVSGYSGVGKSAVVHELHKSLVPPRGLFASGKFDQYKRDIPYATVAQAFQTLIHPLLSRPEAKLSKWRDDLSRTLSPNMALIVDLVPELKLIVGEQPPVAALPPGEAKARSHLAFRRFIGVFARREHPLALFLDDLQWLDAATLDFLEDLLVQDDLGNLLVVGAYRANEVDSTHPLMRKLSAIREAGGTVQEIGLAPLSSNDLAHLVTDTFHCESQDATPLAQLLYEKTAGNPFFAIQFIHALVEEELVAFDHGNTRWRWDLDAIHAKGYTDNVVDLMVAKLKRLPATTQRALQQFACIGNSAEAATLSAVLETSEQETEKALWEALHQELIVRSEDSWRFAHDRVQEAAYYVIAEEARAEAHLRIGRLLYAHTPPEKLEEAIFEIVNHLNRGAVLSTSDDERFQLAELNLVAGKRAKASTAYVSALKYFIAGEARLPNDCWERRHDLIFQLELHRAECDFLTGELTLAAERIEMLRSQASNTVELAAATCLGIDVYVMLGQFDRAVAIGLEYLRHIAVDWALHPTEEHVRSEYQRIWSLLGSREIEDVVDFPLMSDPVSIATMDVLTKVLVPALWTNMNLFDLIICRAVNLSIEHGNNDGSCLNYVWLGVTGRHWFGDYKHALRFGRLGHELVEKRGLKRFQAATYVLYGTNVMPWVKHLSACCKVVRQACGIADKIGDRTWGVYGRLNLNSLLIGMGNPLVEVQSEVEVGLNFARQAKFDPIADLISTQLRFIRTLRGLTTTFGSFDQGEFEEIGFEQHLASHQAFTPAECWYWIRKLQARFFAGDFVSAVEASLQARSLLLTSPGFDWVDYEFYSALARAGLCDSARAGQRGEHFDALEAHATQLQIWADNCPENFEDRAALAGAEFARIEDRTLDAERLYEQAIRSARSNGFVQNEALSYELAARFYAGRGFETFADAYLRNARDCYDRWGALGKVKQLDERFPRLREGRTPAPSITMSPPFGELDVETVVKASQALSSEMVLPGLIEKLLRIVVENAGAERGLLILIRDGEPQIEAEATTGPGGIDVAVREGQATPSDLPQSALRYVIRTQESVLLDDASSDDVYSKDEYVRQKRSRSVLCLPIVTQAKLVGALYLENNLAPFVFTPDRVAVLQLLASQAAISLENAGLYSDLELQAGLLQKLPVSAWTLKPDGTPDFVNQVWLDYSGQTLDFVRSNPEAWITAVHSEDREAALMAFREGIRSGQGFAVEARSLRARDGVYRWHLNQAVVLRNAEGNVLKVVGTTTDIDDQKRAEEDVRESERSLRLIVDGVAGLVAVMLPTGETESVNRQVLTYFGRTVEELKGWSTSDAVHPDDLPRVVSAWMHSVQTGSVYDVDHRLLRADGVYRWFHARGLPLCDADGRVVRWYVLLTDVHDRTQAEEAVQRSERNLVSIINTIPTTAWSTRPDGYCEFLSDRWLRYAGMTAEQCLGWKWASVIHPDDAQPLYEHWVSCLAAGTPVDTEARMRRYDGVYRWFIFRASPLRDESGNIVRWYGTNIDIEDRKRAEEALANSRIELAHVIRVTSLAVMTASIAHEVNQPLSGIITNASTCLRMLDVDPPNLEGARETARRTIRDGLRASDVITRLRTLYTKKEPTLEPMDLNEATREVIVLLLSELQGNRVILQQEFATDLPIIQGDRIQLQQVIHNLVRNASDAMRDIEDRPRRLLIRTEQVDEKVCVIVQDSGIGFDPASEDRLFESFYTTKPEGMGIGLSVSRSIIEAHGGRLWATANDVSGATFAFSIPYGYAGRPT